MYLRRQGTKGRREAVLDALDRKRLREVARCCVRCHAPGFQLHHVVRRARKDTRHDPENHLALCPACHTWWHANPAAAKAWFVSTFSASRPRICALVVLK